jgi:metallo-beta-lactamase family protein
MKLTFLGAARQVTGSKHLVEAGGQKILLDCGMFQGHRAEAYQANSVLPPAALGADAVILSHAHADHCGLLPLLAKDGYRHKIYATPATIDIARLIMLDSAKLQTNDFTHLTKRLAPGEKLLPPLYSEDDVETACKLFQAAPYARHQPGWQPLGQDLAFKFYDAGHILGSAVTVIKSSSGSGAQLLGFTGDLGNTNVPILPDPEGIEEPIEALISECTYGDKNHPPVEEAVKLLQEVINEAVTEQRKVIVPAFALGRTQELIYILHQLYNSGKIPAIPIYLDSPLAKEITAVFTKYSQDYDQAAWTDFLNNHESPFAFNKLHYISTVEESKALSQKPGPLMIIASSGMLEGGRILHHLENNIEDPSATILLTGYQAENTLGQRLQAGAATVRIYNNQFTVRAKILSLDEFSAHADQAGLLNYITARKNLKKLFLVHTEDRQVQIFSQLVKAKLPNLQVIIPNQGESFEI